MALGATMACAVAGCLAEEPCERYPPPAFNCDDWTRGEDGHLIAKRTLVVGLMQVEEDHYIGGGIRIAGYDYGDLLKRQCAPALPFWKRWLGLGD